jgi:translation elongation factor P/translation initiation factor 5A
MKKLLAMLLGITLGTVLNPLVNAAEKKAGEPGAVVADLVVMEAKVEAVDHQKRTLTLKGPEGKTIQLKVDKGVRNFDQIKVGDDVVADFYDSLAVYVKPHGKPGEGGAELVEMAPRGAKPGAVMVSTAEVAAKITAIDRGKHTLTLEGPEGKTVTLKVHEHVKEFDQLKVGDDVVVRYTEAVAVNVRKPS